MRVEPDCGGLNAPAVLAAVLHEFSAITDYRTLRDSLPRRLASFIQCRSVLLYQRVNETLQLAAGSFDDKPGWSASLLAVAHINPISLSSDTLEARAWRESGQGSHEAMHDWRIGGARPTEINPSSVRASSSRSYSRSSRSRTMSMCSRPRKPQRKPKPSASLVSGSQLSAASFSDSFSSASRRSG